MKTLLQRYFEYFLIGALGLLPIIIIVQIVFYVEGLLREGILSIYDRYESVIIPGGLFLVSVGVVIYVGYLLKQDKAHMLYFFDKLIKRIPVLGTIYRVSQKVLRLFRDDSDNKIKDVVFIEYPHPGLWVPAYITNREAGMVVVYVPTSPNPTSGFTLIVEESKLVPSKLSIEDVSSYVISLGADFPDARDVVRLLRQTKEEL